MARYLWTLCVLIGAVAAWLGTTVPAGLDNDATPATATVDARAALATLTVAERHRDGYDRDLFGPGWVTIAGCTTRQHVLMDEAVDGFINTTTCQVLDGAWVDWYSDGAPTITDPGGIDIDHLVPLRHAWQAGAWAWTPERRIAFANDLDDPATLTAVSASQNRAKADAPPDAWQPPNHGARCRYAADWIDVKTTWQLTVTTTEIDALERMLNTCAPAGNTPTSSLLALTCPSAACLTSTRRRQGLLRR